MMKVSQLIGNLLKCDQGAEVVIIVNDGFVVHEVEDVLMSHVRRDRDDENKPVMFRVAGGPDSVCAVLVSNDF